MEMNKRPSPKYIVIYNPMSAACVLAAALIANGPGVEVIKITDYLPLKESYDGDLTDTVVYWIGVNPFNIYGLTMVERNYYVPDDGSNVLYVDWQGKKVYPDQEEHADYFPDGSVMVTMQKLLFLPELDFEITKEDVGFLALPVDNFQNPKIAQHEDKKNGLTVEQIQKSLNDVHSEMLLIYYNLGVAQMALDSEIKYVLQTECPAGFETTYIQDVLIAKKRLNKNLRRQKATDGEKVYDCSATSFHDFMVHMALRIVRMSNGLFINFTHSSTNPVLYTNIRGVVLDQAKYLAIKLEL